MHFDVLVVGAGHGGAAVTQQLRQGGFIGSIALVGREPEPPYERPPLSKEYLLGEKSFERIMIRPPKFWSSNDIHMILGSEVVSVDPSCKTVTLHDGQMVGYSELVWATGGDPRKLTCPGANLPEVYGVRTRADADSILRGLADTQHVVIVGGGYIGLEAAAVLRKLGKDVTLLEMMPHLLARVAGEAISSFYEREHLAQGVDLRTGTALEAIEGTEHVTGVRLGDGNTIVCQMVIAGIGIIPAVEPLVRAGAKGDNGVNVNEYCQTSLPHVWAIGDCAAHPNSFADGAVIRLESVQNASDQAAVVAKAILGSPQPYAAAPWFWSNQYDLKLQTIGLSTGHDKTVLRGDPENRQFSVISLRDGRVIALDCVNSTKDYVQGRKLLNVHIGEQIDSLADLSISLKSIMLQLENPSAV